MNTILCKRKLPSVTSLVLLLWLGSCASPNANITAPSLNWIEHQQTILAVPDWELSGRLNVRQNGQSDTVSINWQQQQQDFSLHLSGTLGLGAVFVHGTPTGVTVEKVGKESIVLDGLQELTREYLGYDFPTAFLLYWVRGIPAPSTLAPLTTLDTNSLLVSLIQADENGRPWELDYDRYQSVEGIMLPGRIRVSSAGIQLTFLINEWLMTGKVNP